LQEALGELAGAAQEGLLALSVGVGLGVLREMMEAELDEVVGAKHATIAGRTAVRHGHEDGEVTLGGRRVGVKRPRARPPDGEHELPLATYAHFADRDPLTRGSREAMEEAARVWNLKAAEAELTVRWEAVPSEPGSAWPYMLRPVRR